jgi:hypothetical protein
MNKPLKVKDILVSYHTWVKGYMSKDNRGNYTQPQDENACRWCLSGAICKAYADDNKRAKALVRLEKIIKKEYGFNSIVTFNDNWRTTFKDVRRVVEKANI